MYMTFQYLTVSCIATCNLARAVSVWFPVLHIKHLFLGPVASYLSLLDCILLSKIVSEWRQQSVSVFSWWQPSWPWETVFLIVGVDIPAEFPFLTEVNGHRVNIGNVNWIRQYMAQSTRVNIGNVNWIRQYMHGTVNQSFAPLQLRLKDCLMR